MRNDFQIDHLPERQQRIARLVLRTINNPDATGGGCRAFYAPEEWKDRGEEFGTMSDLVIVHDGGDLAPWFNLDYGRYGLNDRMQDALARKGLYVEQCTSWYSAIYPV